LRCSRTSGAGDGVEGFVGERQRLGQIDAFEPGARGQLGGLDGVAADDLGRRSRRHAPGDRRLSTARFEHAHRAVLLALERRDRIEHQLGHPRLPVHWFHRGDVTGSTRRQRTAWNPVSSRARLTTSWIELADFAFAFMDCEFGGLDPELHDITEVAVIVTDYRLDELASGEWKIAARPHRITREAAEISGYRAEDWQGAPHLREVLAQIDALLPSGKTVVPAARTCAWT
jgi:hypothetical protein